MLLALSGVTGIGKSYFTEKLVTELNFNKVNTIRTRPIRIGERNGVDGIFITEKELDDFKNQDKNITSCVFTCLKTKSHAGIDLPLFLKSTAERTRHIKIKVIISAQLQLAA